MSDAPRRLATAPLLAALLAVLAAPPATAYEPAHLGFAVRFRNEVSDYRVLGVYVLPGEELPLRVVAGAAAGPFRLTADAGTSRRLEAGAWSWRAPMEPGLYPLRVDDAGTGEQMTLNVFVLVPARRVVDGMLEGYRIGAYPASPFRGLAAYRRPAGFLRVTPELLDVPVSPHFRLRQFLCKQAGGYPKFVVLRERLPLKLERILEELNRRGHAADSLFVMSGYRTPAYNVAIGNVRNSRHTYGDAADVFLDENPTDGVMDDLDGNGVSDARDAELLRDLVEDLARQPWWQPFVGGLARYRTNASHGPFVHVDTRGYRARW